MAFATSSPLPTGPNNILSLKTTFPTIKRPSQRITPKSLLLSAPTESPTPYSPVLILPGLGNSKNDYKTLAETLITRGHSLVGIAPVQRWQWSLNAKGFLTRDYWQGTLKPNNVLNWYFDLMDTMISNLTADNPQQPINVVGHSAGGWLCCAYLAERASPTLKVSSLVTLGTPHKSPPNGGFDQTRGLLSYIEEKCEVGERVSNFVCVAGKGTVGKPLGKGSLGEYVAYLSYAAVCGEGEVDGDGVTPITAACAQGGELVICEECGHSMLTNKGDWYGAEGRIDKWIQYLE